VSSLPVKADLRLSFIDPVASFLQIDIRWARAVPLDSSRRQASRNGTEQHGGLTSTEAAEILGKPVASEKVLPGDAQSCVFTTADLTTLTISLRPGLGRAMVDTWAAGKMPVTNVSGVGERAVWQSTLKEIDAEKNNLLCDIGVVGPGHSAGATPEKLGALCNKIFAAM
jgi:hypothetical protein